MADITCTVNGCDRAPVGRGLCRRDYQRAKKAGLLHLFARPPARPGEVLAAVCDHYRITLPDLIGRRHTDRLAEARRLAVHALVDLGATHREAGRMIGRSASWTDGAIASGRPDVELRCTPQRTTRPGCDVDGCDRPARHGKLGLCPAHYVRWRRHGDLRLDVEVRSINADGAFLPLAAHDSRGYRAGCRCDDCRADAVRRVKRNRHDPKMVAPDIGRERLEQLLRAGLTVKEVAARSGVDRQVLDRWRHRPDRPTHRDRVAAVLAVAVPCVDCGAETEAGGLRCWPCFAVATRRAA